MGRVRSFLLLCALTALAASLPGCGKKSSGVPVTTIQISPASLSLEQGKYSGLSVTDNNGTAIAVGRITWLASDGSALSVGVLAGVPTVCAGSWDSLTAPTVCRPGPAKAIQLTASSGGATSAPITVFVHQHIERLVATPMVSPAPNCGTSSIPGLSAPSQFAAAGFADYQVLATNNGNDITSTIGPIAWNSANSTVVTLTTAGNGLLFNQVRATAKAPGQTPFFATAAGAASAPLTFTTCPVASIALANSTGGHSLTFPKGAAAQTITATVLDAAGLALTSPPITWSSTNPTVAPVSTTGVITGAQTGAASVTASCLPSNCNIGFLPPPPAQQTDAPIYPAVGVGVTVTGAASSTTAYAASSGCWDRANGPVLGCLSFIIPIPQTTNTPGAPIALPNTPTSMLMSESGTEIYVGSCVPRSATGQAVCNGVSVVSNAGAVTTNNSVTGDVIGVASSGTKAVVSDTSTTPNQVFLYDQPSNSGAQLLLDPADHAKSAVFSADAFLVYITTYQCTGSPCQASNEVPGPVYVFDSVNQLRRLPAPAGVTDIAFHPSGALVYMATAANTVTTLNTSDNTLAASEDGTQTVALPGKPQFLRALHDWDNTAYTTHFLVLNGPDAPDGEIVQAATPNPLAPPPPPPLPCPFAPNTTQFYICNFVDPQEHFDFGQGPLDASQFLLSSDTSTAYVIPRNFSSVFSYGLQSKQKGGISLTGAKPATTGGLTTDGAFLYVGSTDGLVHVLNTAFSGDTLQISPISSTTNPATSMCSISTATQPCNPDFVLVKP
jgi:hypothetical protein